MLRLAILATAILPLAVTPVVAQSELGRIDGRIMLLDGSPVSGVSVVLNELSLTAISDAAGLFAFTRLRPGTYSVTCILGANTTTQGGVQVAAAQATVVEEHVDWEAGFVETLTVYGASRRVERIVDAPAAVTVVDRDRIEQIASHGQVPKIMEFTPGAEVTQSGLYDFNFNTRGFNSSLNRRVVTLVDGRDPSLPFLGAQEWASLSFPLDDLSTVEFVRGPSAALYGANASSGVLNMTSRAPRYSQGGFARITAGELDTVNLDFRLAQDLGNDWYIKLVGGLRNTGDFAVSRNGAAEYSVPCSGPGQTDCLPQEVVPLGRENDNNIFSGGIRLDKYLSNGHALTFEGGYSDVRGPLFQTGIGRVEALDIRRPWARFNWNGERFNLLTYYNVRQADEQLALSSGSNLALDSWISHTEGQTNWTLDNGRVEVVAGGSYRRTEIDSEDSNTGRQTLMFEPVQSDQGAAFGQVEWKPAERWKFVFAGRFDVSTLHDPQLSPKASVVYNVNPNNTVRLTYNEAFQVANYAEYFLQANAAPPVDLSAIEAGACTPFGVDCGFGDPTRLLAVGNEDLQLEKTKMVELGYNLLLGGKAYLTVDYYLARNDRFITDLIPQIDAATGDRTNPNFGAYAPPPIHPAPAILLGALQANLPPTLFAILSNNFDDTPMFVARTYDNFGKVRTQGIDFSLNYYFVKDWNFALNYSWFDFEIQDETSFADQLQPNTPENKLAAGITYSSDPWNFNFGVRWVDDFRWVVGPFQGNVESYTTADVSANYTFNERYVVGINVTNLFDQEHWQSFGGDLMGRRALGSLTVRW